MNVQTNYEVKWLRVGRGVRQNIVSSAKKYGERIHKQANRSFRFSEHQDQPIVTAKYNTLRRPCIFAVVRSARPCETNHIAGISNNVNTASQESRYCYNNVKNQKLLFREVLIYSSIHCLSRTNYIEKSTYNQIKKC